MTGQRLKEILDTVRVQPDLAPVLDDAGKAIRTYCNVALDRVMGIMAIPRMVNPLNGQPLLANDMIDIMESSPERFTKVSADIAVARAAQGVLVVACQCEQMHGHVAPVYPTQMAWSASWMKQVPVLSNVGQRNDVLRASQCFRTEPDYYSVKIQTAPPEPPPDKEICL